MSDPLSAAGLVLAALTLPAQAFSSCVLAYNTVSDLSVAGKHFGSLFWLFKIQQTRFLVWGQNCDIYSDGLTPERLSLPVYEAIVGTLIQIQDLLQDVRKLQGYYGLKQIPTTNTAEPRISMREIRRQATVVFKVQKSCSMFKKLKWVVKDSNDFSRLIDQLTQYNDALYQFSPLISRSSQTAAVDAEALALAIVDQGWQGVQALQQAVSPNPQNLSPGSNSHLSAQSAAYLRSAQRSSVEDGPSQSLPRFTVDKHLYMEYRHFSLLKELRNDAPQRRSWALIQSYTGYTPVKVVLEWRSYNQREVFGDIKNGLQLRVEALTRMLQASPKPPGFRILDCLGYVEDDSIARFGFVFRYPQHSKVDVPLTLFQIIDQQHPPFLGKRFQLAVSLAESLYELHASRWLHKGINSHNVLFFEGPKMQQSQNIQTTGAAPQFPPSLDNPFLAGFALSRPEDGVSDNLCPDEVEIYRHPDVQGLAGASVPRYHPLYDIYSIGMILLEIGTWCTLKNFYRNGQNGYAFRDRLLNQKASLLGVSMGERYMSAARKCIDGSFEGMSGFQDNERDDPDYIVNLHRSFYWEVVKTLKECHV
ncbi:prion-inhibition and propagation-domain-containing protein [Clohesyomyces aquaticus]|uniref:Prion-inhibition and propagation-domain-containing protein n=1 Tax=Clohesyomyces aquaticus TaxID=1231657 RepID=A0A1Y1Z1B8_9PLEO|nr:prion-inhibition and propagation-domain-containing protein [Clohesyomyces aquaticus]